MTHITIQRSVMETMLEALKTSPTEVGTKQFEIEAEAIVALSEALAAQPAQEPVAWMDEEKKIIYWHNTHETDDYHGFRRTTPLYTTPPAAQPEERNFCSRCGKRTADLTVIHTCTPPQENTE